MTYALYSTALALALALYAPVAALRALGRRTPLNLRERLGAGRAGGPHGWVHAVSVGEALAAAPIVEGLRRAHPELPLVVTTVTATGARIVRERLAHLATHRFFPLDLPVAVRRFVTGVDPRFLICMETELWPNVFRALAARGVPVMIANGRLSDRSFRRYRLLRPLVRRMLAGVGVFAMRSAEDARRIIALGAPRERVFVTGNVKHEPLPEPAGAAELWHRLLGLRSGQRVWIAGSTHRGEEESVLEAHRRALARHPDLVLVVAPRHPERAAEVLSLVAARGWRGVRRSDLPRETPGEGVIVLDTIGELAQLYAIADVVFVGGSLVEAGGHNMLEVALRRKPVLFGPHDENFREAAALLTTCGAAVVVADAAGLAREVVRLLDDSALATRRGEAGYEAVAARQGALKETLDLIERFLVMPGLG